MEQSIFSGKLDELSETVSLVRAADLVSLAEGLMAGVKKTAFSIGSGGSLISAHYFAACRTDLTECPTLVHTPMDFVLDDRHLVDCQVWIFSGRGENADAHAAASAAMARGCADIHIVTSNPVASVFELLREETSHRHILPVFDPKDGFLSTHSLIAAVAALLEATDICLASWLADSHADALTSAIDMRRSASSKARYAEQFGRIQLSDTMIILADPRLRPAAIALETSLWEIALCPVQLTDFRNFAHGRHVWLHRRPHETFLLAMTGTQSSLGWTEIEQLLPEELPRETMHYGTIGRLQQAISIIDALAIVEAMGAANDVDPAKPGVGPNARGIYDGDALKRIEAGLKTPIRKKLKAVRKSGAPDENWNPLTEHQAFVEKLGQTNFHGLVLDYDGTVVATDARLKPPHSDIIAELTRLLGDGLQIGIATGRGGSVSEMLREHIPQQFHSSILVGYYNGGHLRTLGLDIRHDPAPEAEAIRAMGVWVTERAHLLSKEFKIGGVQITVNLDGSANSLQFVRELRAAPLLIERKVRAVFSEHSVDIVLYNNSKTLVVNALANASGANSQVLCIGDSGGPMGNDFELLGSATGISVRDVCHRHGMCWSVFDDLRSGPAALLTILRSLTKHSYGIFQLDVRSLSLGGASLAQ